MMSKREKDTGLRERAEGLAEGYNAREMLAKQVTSTQRRVVVVEPRAANTGKLGGQTEAKDGQDTKAQRENSSISNDETVPSPPMPEARAKLATAKDTEEKKPHILIVEDTQELAEVIQATLESAGMQADSVSHGAKALERIKAKPPQVLLLDIGLPDMTGWKMLEELRDWKKEDNDMPTVIVITAYGDPANRLIGKLQGIHSYLIKPFTSAEVEKVVRSALDKSAGDKQ
jgi:CheY-like chemotaxis protein